MQDEANHMSITQINRINTILENTVPEMTDNFDQAVIEQLQNEVAEWRRKYNDALTSHVTDVSLIGKKLMEMAEDHGWCNEYDDAVNELNDHLSVYLPVRSKKHYLTVTLDIEFTCEPDQATSLADKIARGFKYSSARVGSVDYEVVDATVYEITG